jgi:hypothetical protein
MTIHVGIYGVLAKWTQKKESYAVFSYALMVTMVTLANRDFIDEHGECLVTRLTSHVKKDREAKDETGSGEPKTPRNREKPSLSIDSKSKKDVKSASVSSLFAVAPTLASPSSSTATPLLPSSPHHYLSLLLTYFQTLNEAYVREGGENYNRQTQIATQFLFACHNLTLSSEQYHLLEQTAQTIVCFNTAHLGSSLFGSNTYKLVSSCAGSA